MHIFNMACTVIFKMANILTTLPLSQKLGVLGLWNWCLNMGFGVNKSKETVIGDLICICNHIFNMATMKTIIFCSLKMICLNNLNLVNKYRFEDQRIQYNCYQTFNLHICNMAATIITVTTTFLQLMKWTFSTGPMLSFFHFQC